MMQYPTRESSPSDSVVVDSVPSGEFPVFRKKKKKDKERTIERGSLTKNP